MIFIFFKYFRVLHSSWCSSALLIVFIPSDHALSLTYSSLNARPPLRWSHWYPICLMSTIECVWRIHTEDLLTCLRVIDNWQLISSFAGKKQNLLIFYANLHHILPSIKKESVACLTWLSVKILWIWHVLKLHENLIISSSELNDMWEILIS